MKKIILILLAALFLTSCGQATPSSPPSATPNPDAIAALSIPGTDISAPVLPTEDNSALWINTEYNNIDFSNPVIVIHGSSSGPFNALQRAFMEDGSVQAHSDVVLKLPSGEQHYRVFAAGAYNNTDILRYNLSFKTRANIPRFVDQFMSYHTMIRQVDESITITESDNLLILSTELSYDPSQRFLVLAKQTSSTIT